MKEEEIGYLTDINKPYILGIRKCQDLKQLKAFLKKWKIFVEDSLRQLESKDFSWDEYKKGLWLESHGKFAGEKWAEKYGAIPMPKVLLFIGLVSTQFHVPDGTAFIRIKEAGDIIKNDKGFLEVVR